MVNEFIIRDMKDLRLLAGKMRDSAKNNPIREPIQYSASEEEATQRAKEMYKAKPDIFNTPQISLLKFPANTISNFPNTLYVTIVLTYDEYENPPKWNLSMSLPMAGKPGRVPDPLAGILSEEFIGVGCQEIPPQGAFKAVRQFVKI